MDRSFNVNAIKLQFNIGIHVHKHNNIKMLRSPCVQILSLPVSLSVCITFFASLFYQSLFSPPVSSFFCPFSTDLPNGGGTKLVGTPSLSICNTCVLGPGFTTFTSLFFKQYLLLVSISSCLRFTIFISNN